MRTQFVLIGLTLILAATAPSAQQAAQLTALDYYQIHELNARFSHALDRGDADGFAALFTPDGVLVDEDGRIVTGRGALSAHAAASPGAGPTNVRHFYTNLVITPAASGVTTRSHAMVAGPRQGPSPGRIVTTGQYWDDLVRSPEGWRIRRRMFYRENAARPVEPPIGAAAPVFASAREQANAHGLTAADYAQIYQLYAAGAIAFDKALDHGRAWADLFTPDGTYVDHVSAEPFSAAGVLVRGRADLMELVAARGSTHAMSLVGNIVLERTAQGVSGKAYLMRRQIPQMATGRGGRPLRTDVAPPIFDEAAGMLVDEFVRTSAGWRIRARQVVASGAPVPRSGPAGVAGSRSVEAVTRQKGDSPALTSEDLAEIQHLYARYAHGIDSRAGNGAVYASVFTPDGRFIDSRDFTTTGVKALTRVYIDERVGEPSENKIAFSHVTWDVMVTAAPWGAAGHAYMANGMYDDTLVKTAQGWRFRYRVYRLDIVG